MIIYQQYTAANMKKIYCRMNSAGLGPIICLMRFDKPWGTVLLLWPTLWALWLANNGTPPIHLVSTFTLGAILMRACGCVLNDWCDRKIDSQVLRTKNRPLASGSVSTKAAMITVIVLMTMAASLLIFLNNTTRQLAVLGMVLTLLYPTSKRWLHCPQLFLGVTFAWGIPMAYAASQQPLGLSCWSLYLATCFWIIGYDSIYAMEDLTDDKKLPIHTMPKYLDGEIRLFVMLVYAIFWFGLALLATVHQLAWPFYVFLALTGPLLHNQLKSIGHQQAGQYLNAFKQNQWVGALVWLGFVLGLAWR